MRILFDHGVPAPLRRHLPGHAIDTAADRGWEALANGDLLDRVDEGGYEILITTDQSMQYQQNLAERPFAVLVLMSTAWPNVRERVDDIRAAIDAVRAGESTEVEI